MAWVYRNGKVSTSELARRLDQHILEYRLDKAEINRKLDEHGDASDKRHEENLVRFGRIDRTIYIATGAGLAAAWVFSHGGELLAKLLK